MKTVFATKDEVAHLFAHQTQSTARDPKNRIFFRDSTIYSYGHHFPIATHYGKGEKKVLLFTTESYSPTTAAHIRSVASACSHLKKIYCSDPEKAAHKDHVRNLENFNTKAAIILQKIKKSTKPEIHLAAFNQQKDLYLEYVNYFKISKKARKPYIFIESDPSKDPKVAAKEILAKVDAYNLKVKKAKEKAAKKATEQAEKDFRGYEKDTYYNPLNPNETFLRLSQDGQQVETSKGVKIPLKVARRILDTLKKVKGTELVDPPYILDYPLNQCDDKGIRVGCHAITWEEINQIKFPA